MNGDGDTRPGFHHPARRSSRPPADIAELPEPLISASPPLRDHITELHQDLRALRGEMLNRQDAERNAIYQVKEKVDRLQAAVEGLRTCQDLAFKSIRDGGRTDRWVIGAIGLAILIVLLLRAYRLIGV